MADKPRDWGGLNVNFQNMPPRSSTAPLVLWGIWMIRALLVLVAIRLVVWMMGGLM